ncbi:MAG: hypothetical protein U0271_01565 [Polyangiaceae bacterium]
MRGGTPKHDSSGAVESFTGWFAELHEKGIPTLHFGIESERDMCWCTDEWVGYRLNGLSRVSR